MANEQTIFNYQSPNEWLTCKSCKHRQIWECNSKIFQYCGVRKSNRTYNGLLKIKCKDHACGSYEPSK